MTSPRSSSTSSRPLITSETDAIRVDFLPAELLPAHSRLGMTIAPGKQNFGMQAIWQRNLQTDLRHLHDAYHVDRLVTLLEKDEMAELAIPTLLSDAATYGMKTRWFPIPDFNTPTSMQGLFDLVQDILSWLQQQETVVVHCKGGLGRSGLVAASCLAALGHTPDDAFAYVRRVRPGSVETSAQEDYVIDFAKHLQQGNFPLQAGWE